eukprot:11200793-Lingulodinium_polyedra.AAC.1
MAAQERHLLAIRARVTELHAIHELHNPVRGRGEHLVPHVFEETFNNAIEARPLNHALHHAHGVPHDPL